MKRGFCILQRINYFAAVLTLLIFVTSFHLGHDAKQFQKYDLLATAHTILSFLFNEICLSSLYQEE